MSLKAPKNINYCAVVVDIKAILPLEGCDNLVGAMLCGNHVIIGKNTPVGTVGLYFPVETQLSDDFLKNNNLYRTAGNNADTTKKGYFDDNGRVRCQKFKGHQSNGFFIPLDSLSFIKMESLFKGASPMVNLGDEFDELSGIEICRKYIPKNTRTPGAPGSANKSKGKKAKIKSKLIDNQFRFHYDTAQLGRNLHKVNPGSLLSMTYKVHGTSGISAKVLCKNKLTWLERALKWSKLARIFTYDYDFINSSRKVIKNAEFNANASGFYSEDIWSIADAELRPFLLNGMTLYYEIVGYLPNGGAIQGSWDYGCKPGEHKIFIYRITFTNNEGHVFEFSARQVQDWCKAYGLVPVPELFYGYGFQFLPMKEDELVDAWRDRFLAEVVKRYNEKDCYMCYHKVPEEGAVIKVEGLLPEAFKQKSFRFLDKETRDLDAGNVDIETEQSE